MPLCDLLTIAELKALFAAEMAAVGGTVADTFEDGRRLFTRSILPPLREVRKTDHVQGGVALRANLLTVWVHPYVFRLVCRNGAIVAHAIQTRQLEAHEFATPEEAAQAVRDAVRTCGSSEAFLAAAEEMRSAGQTEADLALALLPVASRLPANVLPDVMRAIMERFFQDADPSRFGLMNAVTSVARDTPDPEIRWRLEEFGGGILAGRTPRLQPDDQAVAVVGQTCRWSEEWLARGAGQASCRNVS